MSTLHEIIYFLPSGVYSSNNAPSISLLHSPGRTCRRPFGFPSHPPRAFCYFMSFKSIPLFLAKTWKFFVYSLVAAAGVSLSFLLVHQETPTWTLNNFGFPGWSVMALISLLIS